MERFKKYTKNANGFSQITVALVLLVVVAFILSKFLFGDAGSDGAINASKKTSETIINTINNMNGTMPVE